MRYQFIIEFFKRCRYGGQLFLASACLDAPGRPSFVLFRQLNLVEWLKQRFGPGIPSRQESKCSRALCQTLTRQNSSGDLPLPTQNREVPSWPTHDWAVFADKLAWLGSAQNEWPVGAERAAEESQKRAPKNFEYCAGHHERVAASFWGLAKTLFSIQCIV